MLSSHCSMVGLNDWYARLLYEATHSSGWLGPKFSYSAVWTLWSNSVSVFHPRRFLLQWPSENRRTDHQFGAFRIRGWTVRIRGCVAEQYYFCRSRHVLNFVRTQFCRFSLCRCNRIQGTSLRRRRSIGLRKACGLWHWWMQKEGWFEIVFWN